MNNTVKGYLAGVVSAVSYGMNPLGALYMYDDGMRPTSVLFWRFSLAALMLLMVMVASRKSLACNRREGLTLAALGLLFIVSSVTYYSSFLYIDAGIACTVLFFYPVMVAVIMAMFFHERITVSTVGALVLSLVGILLLYRGDGETRLSSVGMLLVMVSALSCAVYIVLLNRSSLRMSSVKLTLFVLTVCVCSLAVYSWLSGQPIQMPPTTRSWVCAFGLALVPTVISLLTMAVAVRLIGSTPTAIMGALEPVTAVAIGVSVFGEAFTPSLALGILLIMLAVMLIIVGGRAHPMRLARAVLRRGKQIVKHWRWR